MPNEDEGATLIYGSTETAEDLRFWLGCNNAKKTTETTLYVDNADSKVGQKVTLEFGAGNTKTSLKGKFSTDELIGPFAEATGFQVKPLIEVFKAKGPVTVKTAEIVTELPEKGRAKAVTSFAKACSLD
jgi:hypothetical protein